MLKVEATMQIGRRVRLEKIREVWSNENDFSDWLASEDGVALLAEDLGIEIENLVRESSPGEFRCDIVGNLLGDENHIVVIENQYGKTNHDHLGKLLTYAAVHKALTGIWISETISDDHRQVVDWLNENTPTNVNLYLVALRLYRIGDSPVAPQLDVVSRPNLTVKESKGSITVTEKERHSWRLKTWTAIHDTIRASNPPFRHQRASVNHWSSISIGRSGIYLNMLLNSQKRNIGIDLYIKEPWRKPIFQALEEEKATIEHEVGASLEWIPQAGEKTARILLKANIDPKKPENEGQVREWFAKNSIRMYNVFRQRVLNLTSSAFEPEFQPASDIESDPEAGEDNYGVEPTE